MKSCGGDRSLFRSPLLTPWPAGCGVFFAFLEEGGNVGAMPPKIHFIVMVALVCLSAGTAEASSFPAQVSVCFTPGQNCEARIVAAIDHARDSIMVQAYGFTSLPIIHALQRAAARGVDVLAILDKTNRRKYSGATLLLAKGIPVWIDAKPAIAHNKVIIIDKQIVIGGSFNYTASAQKRNAENVTFTESPAVAKQFIANWNRRLQASDAFSLPRK